ncbi:MAG TPA: hypothetical protein VMD52_00580 [Patescibacteria group bacterium]|nr:hypothetical protein [Patescibacteria group bacterium]
MNIRVKAGVSLIEILVAVLIFTLAMGGLLSCVFSTMYLSEISRNSTIATADLKNIMEKIRATPFDHLTADFPHNVQDGPIAKPYQNIVGAYRLTAEHITVTYANPNGDPLEIKATAVWQDKRGRNANAALYTFKTR